MGMLYDAAPPGLQKAMRESEEFHQAVSAAAEEGGKVGDLSEYAFLSAVRESLPQEQRRRLDELETSLPDAGVSPEALDRLRMAFPGELSDELLGEDVGRDGSD